MKIIFIIIVFSFFSANIFAEKSPLKIYHWTLKNKTHIYFVRRTEVPMLDIALVFSAGSARDGDQPGLAALTNAMIGEGTKNSSAHQIAETFENVGAQFQTGIDRDMASITLRILSNPSYLIPALHNFETVITSPTFPKNELDRVKQQFISQLQSEQQDPAAVANNQFYKLLYRTHFYAHNPLGTVVNIRSLKQTQLIQFYKHYYTGENAYLILVGDITTTQAKAFAKQIAGNLKRGKVVSELSDAKNDTKPIVSIIHFPSTQNTIMMGQVGIIRSDPDYYSLMVGNAIFGGLPMSSILYHEIREKRGFAYSVSSVFNPLEYRGPFMIDLQTKADTSQEAILLVSKLLQKFIQQGPTQAQLNAAKKSLTASFPLAIASNRGILAVVTNIAYYGRPLDYLDTYSKNISRVTCASVKKAFQKTVHFNKMVTVVVGKK